jgi:RNA polymerase sigma-70 factor, ECF subfamily
MGSQRLIDCEPMPLVDARTVDWQDRKHFWAVASTTMRRILGDAARARAAVRRGGELQRVDATTRELDRLPDLRANRAEEICALDVSTQTVLRDWRLARAWLATELRRPV